MIRKFINDKLYSIEKKLAKVEQRKKINGVLGTTCVLGLAATSFLTLGVSLGLSLAVLSSAGLVGLLTTHDKKLKNDAINKYNQELEHIEKVCTNGIKTNKKLSEKRNNKIKELKSTLEAKKVDLKATEKKFNISTALTMCGIGLTAVVSPILIVAPVLGIILTGSYGLDIKDSNEAIEKLNNRIDNLETDVEIINTATEANSKKEEKAAPEVKKALGDTKSKKINPNEVAIDKYISSLANKVETENRNISKR